MKKYAGKIMKFTLFALVYVILAIICIMPAHRTLAAPTMTTAIDEIDAWAIVAAGTIREGTADQISDSYKTILYIEVALIEAVAQDGVTGTVEVSYADDNWMELVSFGGTAETAATTTLSVEEAAGQTVLSLTDASTGDFDIVARKWFIKDGTIGNSESVKTKSVSTNDVTVLQDTLRTHATASDVYDRVDEWVVNVPFGVAWVRVLINNTDADCDVASTTRISKVTAL